MAAYNAGGSLTWAAVLNASQFNSGIQSMVAQMAYAQRASSGLQASLAGIATVSFAAVIGGIGAMTASIAIASKATADWETQMMGLARVAIPEFDYTLPEGKAAFTEFSRAFQGMYLEIPVKNREELTKAAEPYALAGYEGQTLYGLTEKTLKMMQATNYELSGDDISNLVIKSAQINRKESGIDSGDPTKILQYSDNLLDAVLEVSNKYTISTKDLTNAVIDAGGSAVTRGNENDIPGQLAFYALLNQYGVRPDLMRTMLSSSVSTAGMAGDSTARIESALNKIGMQTRDAEGKKIAEFSRAEVASKLLGVTVDQYQKMANTDMNRTQIRLIDAIENLDADRLTKNALGTGMFGAYAGRETSKLGAGGAEETYTKMEAVAKAAYTNGDQVESQYQNMLQTINSQWDLMTQRMYSVKEVFGEIFQGPVLAGIKSFSESAKGAVQWLTKIVDGSRNLDGTVNTWNALTKIASDLKQKFVDLGGIDFLKAGGVAAGLLLIATNLGIIKTAAGVAAKSLMTLAGVTLGPTATALLGLLGPLSAIGLAAAGVAVGLAAIGYSLAPEKFTYFNQLATEAINGVSVVVKQLYTDLSTGDWSAAATHLKDAFMATIAWLQGIDWGRLGSEIVTMIGDGAKAIIDVALDIGGWIYDTLKEWVTGNRAYALGSDIGTKIGDGIKQLIDIDYGGIIKKAFGLIATWATLGWDIGSAVVGGILDGINQKLPSIQNSLVRVFINAMAEISDLVVRTMNTAIILADTAVTKIKDAFSLKDNSVITAATDLYNDIANPLGKLADDKTKYFAETNSYGFTLDDEVDAINNREQYSSDFYTSVSKITDSASKLNTALVENKEAYMANTNTVAKEVNEKKSSSGSNKYTPPAPTSTNVVTGAPTTPSSYPDDEYSSTSSWGGIGGIGKGVSEVYKAISNGYLTGGKGYVKEEMLPGSKEGTYSSITDKGYNTLLWQMELNERQLGLLIDSPNAKSWADAKYQEYLNGDLAIKPAKELESSANKLKTSSDEAAKITTSGATSSVNILKDGIFESTISWKDATDYSSKNTISATDFINSTTRSTAVETSSITKKAVAESYSPVKIGLTESGQQIAVIGKVAQQQFEQSGNKWMNDTGSAGVTFNSDTTSGGKSIRSDIGIAGDEFIGKVAGLQLGGSIKGMFDGTGKSSSGYEDPIIKELGSVVATDIDVIKNVMGWGKTTTAQATPDQLLRYVEDITCTGDRVMINTGVYTSPTGEQTAYDPMDNEETRLLSNKVEGTFQDMTCIGTTVNIPGLKYTNPYGVTSYINPNEYNSGGGVLDYQQQASTTVNAAKDAGKITVDSAKTSSEYAKGGANASAQAIDGSTQRWVTAAEIQRAQEQNAAIERGEVYRNTTEFVTDKMETSYFDFSKVMDTGTNQAYDMFSRQLTTNDIEYKNNLEIIELGKQQATMMKDVNGQLGGLVSSIDSAGANLNASFGSMLASLSASMGNRSGAFGGTSIGGGGQYVGMGSTNPANAVPWGGTAASIYAQMNSTMPRFGSVSWGAKGSLIEEPTRLIAGEKGRELLLPNNLTELFMKLAALGFNNVNGNGGSGDTVIIVNIDGEQVEKVVSRRQKRNLNLKGLKLH